MYALAATGRFFLLSLRHVLQACVESRAVRVGDVVEITSGETEQVVARRKMELTSMCCGAKALAGGSNGVPKLDKAGSSP
jgi:hypothetical protein